MSIEYVTTVQIAKTKVDRGDEHRGFSDSSWPAEGRDRQAQYNTCRHIFPHNVHLSKSSAVMADDQEFPCSLYGAPLPCLLVTH